MASFERTVPCCVGLMLFVFLAGCRSQEDRWTRNRPRTVPVTGEVVYQGKPLAGAVITFLNEEANRSASAKTDAKGRFSLKTFVKNDGAVPGSQQVSIYKVENDYPGTSLAGLSREEQLAAMKIMSKEELQSLPPVKARWLIPERYGLFKTSELTAEVVDGGKNHFRYELQD